MNLKLAAKILIVSAFATLQVNAATVSFTTLQGATLQDSSGNPLNSGVAILVADTTNGGFSNFTAGTVSYTFGSLLPGSTNIIVLKAFDLTGQQGVLDSSAVGLTLGASQVAGSLYQGDKVGLMWFPSLSLANFTLTGGASYGFYSNAVSIDGSAAWVTPNPGGSWKTNTTD